MAAHRVVSGPCRWRVLIADDHTLARDGLRQLLGTLPEVEVVATAASGREAVRLCGTLRPDLLITDLRMPDLDGIEVVRAAIRLCPTMPALIVTVADDAEYLTAATAAGAAAIVSKDASLSDLVAVVRTLLHRRPPTA